MVGSTYPETFLTKLFALRPQIFIFLWLNDSIQNDVYVKAPNVLLVSSSFIVINLLFELVWMYYVR